MKKYVLLMIIGLVFSSIHLWGQREEDLQRSEIDFFPQSPINYEFNRAQFIPVGLMTGTPNVNIELFNQSIKDVNIPISLIYASNGIKVNQIESLVGLGWNFIVGGSITRTIRGQNDIEVPIMNLASNASDNEKKHFYYGASFNDTNTEYDLYSFNFLGESGQFYLKKDDNQFQVKMITENKLKVVMSRDSNHDIEFEFINLNGDHFYFKEKEISISRTIGGTHSTPNDFISGWYLSKIITHKNQEIVFEYMSDEFTYSLKNQRLQVPYPRLQDVCDRIQVPNTTFYNVENSTRVIQKKISKIKSQYHEINFLYEEEHPSLGFNLLTHIAIKNNNKIIKNIDFHYLKTANNRVFLGQINDSNENHYSFDYINPNNVPKLNSNSQDYWGYFNDIGNATLIPDLKKLNAAYTNYYVSSQYQANRDPNPSYSKVGLLKEIQYPTKGKQLLEYESNTYLGERKVYPGTNKKVELFIEASEAWGGSDEEELEISSIDQNITLYGGTSTVGPPYCGTLGDPTHWKAKYHFEIINLDNNSSVPIYYETNHAGLQPVPWPLGENSSVNPPFFANLKAGVRYKAKIRNYRECTASSMAFNYYVGAPPYIEPSNIITGGNRIKKSILEDGNGNLNIKRYYYGKIGSLEQSSGDKGIRPIYVSNVKEEVKCDAGNSGGYYLDFKTYKRIASDSRLSLFDTGSNNIYYKNIVISLGGDHFEQGGEEYDFIINRDEQNGSILGEVIYETPKSNTGWNHGKRIYTKYFRKNDNNYTTLKKVISQYTLSDNFYNREKNYVVTKQYNKAETPSNINEKLNNLNVAVYDLISYWDYHNKTIEILYDENGNNPITTQTDYQYNNPAHQQVTKTTVSNSKGEVIETSYQYAHEKNNTRLINENRIGIPLQTTVTKGGTTVSDQLTQYATFGNLYLPQYIFSKKGATTSSTATDRKLTYDRYDAKGNLLQYHTEDGLYTSILWGYNGQYPIAKVEGARYDEISSYANNINGLRLAVPHAMVTTYTYEPLVGVTSITDPSGQVQTFEYDAFNRLKCVKDSTGKIVKEYTYHYQN